MIRFIIHIILHVAAPAAVAYRFSKKQWFKTWLILMAGLLIDLDHLLADPITDPNRCSLGFHPLHTKPAMVIYLSMLMHPRTRLWGLGLVIHMVLDGLDCLWMRLY